MRPDNSFQNIPLLPDAHILLATPRFNPFVPYSGNGGKRVWALVDDCSFSEYSGSGYYIYKSNAQYMLENYAVETFSRGSHTANTLDEIEEDVYLARFVSSRGEEWFARIDEKSAMPQNCLNALFSLLDYPVLNESRYSDMEWEARLETWENAVNEAFVYISHRTDPAFCQWLQRAGLTPDPYPYSQITTIWHDHIYEALNDIWWQSDIDGTNARFVFDAWCNGEGEYPEGASFELSTKTEQKIETALYKLIGKRVAERRNVWRKDWLTLPAA